MRSAPFGDAPPGSQDGARASSTAGLGSASVKPRIPPPQLQAHRRAKLLSRKPEGKEKNPERETCPVQDRHRVLGTPGTAAAGNGAG